jgi:hypothetical protein
VRTGADRVGRREIGKACEEGEADHEAQNGRHDTRSEAGQRGHQHRGREKQIRRLILQTRREQQANGKRYGHAAHRQAITERALPGRKTGLTEVIARCVAAGEIRVVHQECSRGHDIQGRHLKIRSFRTQPSRLRGNPLGSLSEFSPASGEAIPAHRPRFGGICHADAHRNSSGQNCPALPDMAR